MFHSPRKRTQKVQKCSKKRQNHPQTTKNGKNAKNHPEIAIKRKINEKSSHGFRRWISPVERTEKQKMRKPAGLCKVPRVIKLLILLVILRFLESAMQNLAGLCKVPLSILGIELVLNLLEKISSVSPASPSKIKSLFTGLTGF